MSTTNLEVAPIGQDPEFSFRFVRFDSERRRRGLPATCLVVIVDGVEDDVVWFSQKDLENNLEIFGRHEPLLRALAYYSGIIAATLSAA
jgi:hypothetical protein